MIILTDYTSNAKKTESDNYRGLPVRSCPACGCDTFKIVVGFDDDNDISWYSTGGYCYGCGAAVTVPTPIDREVLD